MPYFFLCRNHYITRSLCLWSSPMWGRAWSVWAWSQYRAQGAIRDQWSSATHFISTLLSGGLLGDGRNNIMSCRRWMEQSCKALYNLCVVCFYFQELEILLNWWDLNVHLLYLNCILSWGKVPRSSRRVCELLRFDGVWGLVWGYVSAHIS